MRYPSDVTAARHERILQEASRLFRERGLNGVGVRETMKAAKLTHGPFYSHFASREALVMEVIDRALSVMVDEISSARSSKAARRQFLYAYLSGEHRDNPGDGYTIAALASGVARNSAAKAPFTRCLTQGDRRVAKVATALAP